MYNNLCFNINTLYILYTYLHNCIFCNILISSNVTIRQYNKNNHSKHLPQISEMKKPEEIEYKIASMYRIKHTAMMKCLKLAKYNRR